MKALSGVSKPGGGKRIRGLAGAITGNALGLARGDNLTVADISDATFGVAVKLFFAKICIVFGAIVQRALPAEVALEPVLEGSMELGQDGTATMPAEDFIYGSDDNPRRPPPSLGSKYIALFLDPHLRAEGWLVWMFKRLEFCCPTKQQC